MADLAIPIAPSLAPFDPNVSNGTCFFAAGRAHTVGYIPCGNSGSPGAGGGARPLPCCLAGDYCQSSNACYSPSSKSPSLHYPRYLQPPHTLSFSPRLRDGEKRAANDRIALD